MRTNIFTNQLVTQDKGWGALYLENHDQPRSINKYIPEEWINDYSKNVGDAFMLLRGTFYLSRTRTRNDQHRNGIIRRF